VVGACAVAVPASHICDDACSHSRRARAPDPAVLNGSWLQFHRQATVSATHAYTNQEKGKGEKRMNISVFDTAQDKWARSYSPAPFEVFTIKRPHKPNWQSVNTAKFLANLGPTRVVLVFFILVFCKNVCLVLIKNCKSIRK
jgi:hypothetical protein